MSTPELFFTAVGATWFWVVRGGHVRVGAVLFEAHNNYFMCKVFLVVSVAETPPALLSVQ